MALSLGVPRAAAHPENARRERELSGDIVKTAGIPQIRR
jgi:hypothetical protein